MSFLGLLSCTFLGLLRGGGGGGVVLAGGEGEGGGGIVKATPV